MPFLRRLIRKTKVDKASRQGRRRAALLRLNTLAEELQLEVDPLNSKETRAAVITRRIRLLEPRCQHGDFPRRLRAAVEAWRNNGGKLTREVLPQPSDPADSPDCVDGGSDVPTLPSHKVLASGFRLKSRAFMMTFNCKDFTQATWPAFRAHVQQLCKKFKARAWAANWEQSLEAANAGSGVRFHGHGYLFWTDESGLHLRNTDDLVFQAVRPRIDVCTTTNPKAFRLSASRGLWYVSILKKGTCKVDTNYPPWQQYTPKAAWLDDLWGRTQADTCSVPGTFAAVRQRPLQPATGCNGRVA